MKYMLDIVLVLALCWLGWAWNGEKQNGLALSDEIDQLKTTSARLELDLGKATKVGVGTWLGIFVGIVLKLTLAFAMIGIFALAWWRD